LAVDFFRDAQLALVELGDDVVDSFLELRIGIARVISARRSKPCSMICCN